MQRRYLLLLLAALAVVAPFFGRQLVFPFALHSEVFTRPRTYATILTNRDFLPGLEVLAYSLRTVRSEHRLLVLYTAKSGLSDEPAKDLLGHHPNIDFQMLESLSLGNVSSLTHDRWRGNWLKLRLWTLTHYESIVYLDCDMLVLKNIDDLFELGAGRGFMAAPDWGRWISVGTPKLNGGLLFLRPRLDVYQQMLAATQDTARYRVEEAEQGFLQFFFGAKAVTIPWQYNCQKTLRYSARQLDISQARVLHFVSTKPWNAWSSYYWRMRYVPKAVVASHKADDSWDGENYDDLNHLWQHYYLEGTGYAGNVTVFQGYHSNYCWRGVYDYRPYQPVRLGGPLRRASDLDFSPLYREEELGVTQRSIGEFSVLYLVYSHELFRRDSWVGFTTWKEHIKAHWREGASLDWTRVSTADPRRVFFWYGICMDDFWAFTEIQHPGMQDTVRSVYRSLGWELPAMPRDRCWSYGHMLLMHTSSLAEYVEFSKRFIYGFKQRYGDRCPFSMSDKAVSKREFESRCVGYMLERLVNVWALSSGKDLVFAVDDYEDRLKLMRKTTVLTRIFGQKP